ncbi:adenylyltransferase/cytidyltransferase family protein [Lachnospiraceae bacterium WCA-9-b2]|uniref:Adenylyltransferase/cytidyltransferase family protein n=1 Tax=Sporofaciens musculi TaxID=2681861 RepID=A0A7X3MK71_9FIRM|nr:adenylyltransferase/cytidyltransferase family protein [Sporofaciens musculi]MCI9421158.1 adenylyltransferase/cytidyltransferase family protein [Dorea sp.]MXP77872.1 adenylyltransferase/cytidyltransferase family protein [Sporofaciens musculi]
MVRVITYGTYDVLHYGHIKLLERAKELGDYLIVGVTSDDYDKTRGKINNQQSLMERIAAVKATGIADEVIVEEYEGQKIEDIRKYGVDIFTVGSDWIGYFDYLNEFCNVVYLPRTLGVSSSEIRESRRSISLGLVGESSFLNKFYKECDVVNGLNVVGICAQDERYLSEEIRGLPILTDDYSKLLEKVDAVYIRSQPNQHYRQIKEAILAGKHILCEAPRSLIEKQWDELSLLAQAHEVILMDAVKTAYATAYARLLLLLKCGKIGEVVSVDSTCTSLISEDIVGSDAFKCSWDNIYEWGPTALLPVFQILGTEYKEVKIAVRYADKKQKHDMFVKMNLLYPSAVASIKIGNGVKSEGELIISGTKGYIYVPAPWWKTDYFEIRYEDQALNRRYFYQLDGEGIRYELVSFIKSIEEKKNHLEISSKVSKGITKIMEKFVNKEDLSII